MAKRKIVTDAEHEAAKRVVLAHREQEYRRKAEEAQAYVGKHFRYRNSYSLDCKWWLYGVVTKIDEMGTPLGITFQIDTDGKAEMEPKSRINVAGGGWTPITPLDFARELKKFSAHLERLFGKAVDVR